MAFQQDFDSVRAICCRFCFGSHFQPLGQVPQKTVQNGLSDGISAQFGSLAAYLALVAIFSLLARSPRIPPELPFQQDFGPF